MATNSLKEITKGVNERLVTLGISQTDETAVRKMLLTSCTSNALVNLGKLNIENLTNIAVEIFRTRADKAEEYYGIEGLKVAGDDGENAVALGGFKNIAKLDIIEVENPLDVNITENGVVVYLNSGHVGTLKSVDGEKVLYLDNNTGQEGKIIKELKDLKDMGYTGIMLVDNDFMLQNSENKNIKLAVVNNLKLNSVNLSGLDISAFDNYVQTKTVKGATIRDVFGIKGNVGEVGKEFNSEKIEIIVAIEKFLGVIIKAITSPDTSSKESKAVWNMAGGSADGLAQILGYETFAQVNKENIVKMCINKMGGIAKQGESKETLIAIELIAVAGGLLIAMKEKGVNKIEELKNIAPKNSATITELLKKEYRESVMSAQNDFIIDISKLQKTVTGKINYTLEKNKILDVLIDSSIDNGATKEKMLAIMKLSDVRAVAQAA